jgi:hypothetical protein
MIPKVEAPILAANHAIGPGSACARFRVSRRRSSTSSSQPVFASSLTRSPTLINSSVAMRRTMAPLLRSHKDGLGVFDPRCAQISEELQVERAAASA